MRRPPRPFLRTLSVALLAVAAWASAFAAGASTGSDRFLAGQVYRGEFADPSVLQVGRTYYAFATNTDGDNLPVMRSSDLVTWRPRPAYPAGSGYSSWIGYNDGFPSPASWAIHHTRNGHNVTDLWAPSVGHVGSRYVLAYVVPVRVSPPRHCIALATATSPMGPYRNISSSPFVCSSDPGGSIDPQVLTTSTGAAYLLWKNAGVPRHSPTTVWSRRLTSSGTAFAAGSRAHQLLATAQRWEGTVIENPAMIQYGGRYYLFYSGNGFNTAAYATGYAICSGPLGPCRRPARTPLLASTGAIAGPGGATPFVGPRGGLRLAYAAWRTGHVGYPSSAACVNTAGGCNQRRLHVAALSVGRTGLLKVTALG